MEYAFSLCLSSYHSLLIVSDLGTTCLAWPLMPFKLLALGREGCEGQLGIICGTGRGEVTNEGMKRTKKSGVLKERVF